MKERRGVGETRPDHRRNVGDTAATVGYYCSGVISAEHLSEKRADEDGNASRTPI